MNKPKFNPDEPFEVIGKPKFNPDEAFTPIEDDNSDTLGALARGGAQGATAGFADELSGLLGAAGEKAASLVPGSGLGSKSFADLYRDYRDSYRKGTQDIKSKNPLAFGAGEIGSSVALGLATGGAASIPAAAAFGGANALGNSDADLTKGEYQQAARDTAIGSTLGGATQGLLPIGLSAARNAGSAVFNPLSKYLSGAAEDLAVKATGATGNQASKFAPNAGRELLDSGVVGFGNSPAQIATKAESRLNTARSSMDDVLKQLDTQGIKATPEEVQAALAKNSEELSTKAGTLPAFRKSQGLAEDVAQVQGKSPFSLSELEAQKRSFGKANWADPEVAEAQKSTYRGLRDLVEDKATEANPDLAQIFKTEKKAFGVFSPIQEAAEKRASQLNQSPTFGLKDLVGSGTGAAIGGAIGGPVGAVIGGVTGPVATKVIGPRLPAAGAVSLDLVSKTLQSAPQTFGKYAAPLVEATKRGGTALAVTDYMLSQQHPEYRAIKEEQQKVQNEMKDITFGNRNE